MKTALRFCLCAGWLSLALLLSTVRLVRAEDSYLKDMPAVADVYDQISAGDPLSTIARQVVVFQKLREIVRVMSAGGEFGNSMSLAEGKLSSAYIAEEHKLNAKALRLYPGAPKTGYDSADHSWFRLRSGYESSSLAFVQGRFPEAARHYLVKKGQILDEPRTAEDATADIAKAIEQTRRLSPAEAWFAVVLVLVVVGFPGWVLFASSRVGFRGVIGPVVDSKTWSETYVSSSGGGGYVNNGVWMANPVSVHSSTERQDELFIEQKGKQHRIQLRGEDFGSLPGHRVLAVWAQRGGLSLTTPALIRNLTTREGRIVKSAIAYARGGYGWRVFLVLAAGQVLFTLGAAKGQELPSDDWLKAGLNVLVGTLLGRFTSWIASLLGDAGIRKNARAFADELLADANRPMPVAVQQAGTPVGHA